VAIFRTRKLKGFKNDTSITFADGTKVELSEESYNKLRGR